MSELKRTAAEIDRAIEIITVSMNQALESGDATGESLTGMVAALGVLDWMVGGPLAPDFQDMVDQCNAHDAATLRHEVN